MPILQKNTFEDFTEQLLRQKMKHWGIIDDRNEETMAILGSLLSSRYQVALNLERMRLACKDPSEEIENLKKRVGELERRVGGKRIPTEIDLVYEQVKKEYEEKYFGKIIAIDPQLRKVVGIGDSISEAYEKAQKKTKKDQFDFRRVGYSYIDSV
jgi:hypothetical protein